MDCVTVITYRHKPKRRVKKPTAQPAAISGSVVVRARKPKKYQRKLVEGPVDPEGEERVREFYERMGLGAVYQRSIGSPG